MITITEKGVNFCTCMMCNTSFFFTATVEYNDQFRKFVQGMKKHQSGLRHYVHNIMSQSAKKALRKCHQHMKRCMFKRK